MNPARPGPERTQTPRGGADEIERSWVAVGRPSSRLLEGAPSVRIWQCYLLSEDESLSSERVRIITSLEDGAVEYWHTRKCARPSRAGEAKIRHEVEERIGPEEAAQLLERVDSSRAPVEKIRTTFVHAGQEFTLDELTSPVRCWLLEAELAEAWMRPALPDLGCELREVSGVPGWSNRSLAKGVLPPLPPSEGSQQGA